MAVILADDIFKWILFDENIWILMKFSLKFSYAYSYAHAMYNYRQVYTIRRTKFQHLKDYFTVLRLSLPSPLKPDVKSRMKM